MVHRQFLPRQRVREHQVGVELLQLELAGLLGHPLQALEQDHFEPAREVLL